jgi:hypothetical protein
MLDALPKEEECSGDCTAKYVQEHFNQIRHVQLNPTAEPFRHAAEPFPPVHSQGDNQPLESFVPLTQRQDDHTRLQPQPIQELHDLPTYMTSEFSKFLLRKDLMFARLTTFSEKPEAYLSWKKNI